MSATESISKTLAGIPQGKLEDILMSLKVGAVLVPLPSKEDQTWAVVGLQLHVAVPVLL